VGVDNVDVDAATRRGIVVANAPESNVVSAAEHRSGCWLRSRAHSAGVRGSEGGPLGTLEVGRDRAGRKDPGTPRIREIGQQVARRALGLQMRVVAYDPFVSGEALPGARVEADTFEGVLGKSDFITLHLPLNDETRGAINVDSIGKMRDGVRLITQLVVSSWTRQRCTRRSSRARSRAAALDVFGKEPYQGAARAGECRRDAAPAASTDEAQDRAGVIVAEQVVRRSTAASSRTRQHSVRGRRRSRSLLPFVPLAAKLGRLALDLARGETSKITLEYYGELANFDTRLLTVAALNGAFQGRSDSRSTT